MLNKFTIHHNKDPSGSNFVTLFKKQKFPKLLWMFFFLAGMEVHKFPNLTCRFALRANKSESTHTNKAMATTNMISNKKKQIIQ